MAWVRIHDGAMVSLKITALTDSAFRLWVRGLSYCQTALTDGLIPRAALKDMGAKRKDVDMLSTPQVEGRSPLWEPHALGFKVHDYLCWNDCRDKVLERQVKAKQRKDDWEAKKKVERALNAVPNAVPNATKRGRTTKPNQTKPSLPSEEIITGFETFWAVYPKHEGRKAALAWWMRLKPTSEFADTITAGAERYARKVCDWKAQYIKAPVKWLDGAHWEDAGVAPIAAVTRTTDCSHTPRCPNTWAHCKLMEAEASGDPELPAVVRRLYAKGATA